MNESKVEHVGGFFIYAKKPKELAQWYKTHFGMNHETWGDSQVYYISFPYTDTQGNPRYFAWSIMPEKHPRQAEGNGFTINLRVHDLEHVVASLTKNGISVKPIEVHNEGKFSWCEDLEGNALELWEDTPPASKSDGA